MKWELFKEQDQKTAPCCFFINNKARKSLQ